MHKKLWGIGVISAAILFSSQVMAMLGFSMKQFDKDVFMEYGVNHNQSVLVNSASSLRNTYTNDSHDFGTVMLGFGLSKLYKTMPNVVKLSFGLEAAVLPNTAEILTGDIGMKECIDEGGHCSATRNKAVITVATKGSPCTGPYGKCLVFVSTSTMKGDMKVTNKTPSAACDEVSTGLARANCICQSEARIAGYAGTWHAWLSTDEVDAKDNILYTAGHTYSRASDPSVTIATPGRLLRGHLTGPPSAAEVVVWTGTTSGGVLHDQEWTCGSWELDDVGIGAAGRTNTVRAWWSARFLRKCATASSLYCFQG